MTYISSTKYEISDNLLHSHDDEEEDGTTTWDREKKIDIDDLFPTPSTLRVKFDLKSSSAVVTAYGKLYKNGSPIGTERTTTSTSWITFSEDISFAEDDTIELWIKSGTIFEDVYIRNFRVYGDRVKIPTEKGFKGSNWT